MTWPRRLPAVPATCRDLELAAVEKTLIETRGNVSAAAAILEVPSADLRRLVWATPLLADTVFEELERAIDSSMSIVSESLRHENIGRRLEAAAFFLRHCDAARRRGW
jgi:hypothetical protein